ncbi:hypothetical protein KAR91_15580, partial [Candidatus Pacearchaeota archaeon]|nr:hypothetical protein [Candidatus Pacearchaeota archaeon]
PIHAEPIHVQSFKSNTGKKMARELCGLLNPEELVVVLNKPDEVDDRDRCLDVIEKANPEMGRRLRELLAKRQSASIQ